MNTGDTPAPPAARRVCVLEFTLHDGDAAALEQWLGPKLEALVQHPAFGDASIFGEEDASPESAAQRVVHLDVHDGEALSTWLRDDADELRADLANAWGGSVDLRIRTLTAGGDTHDAPRCLNCEAILTGQYCWRCGQRARERLITVHELLRGLVVDAFTVDSRLWRTVVPLLFRPGYLTADYLAGRRVRYLPPFRMYIFLSLLFFLIVSVGTGGLNFTLNGAESARGTLPSDVGICERPRVSQTGVAWLDAQLTPQVLQARCERIVGNPRAFGRALLDAMPMSLLLMLPLLALVIQVLHPFSGRFYAEHLLFVIHYHSFFFLIVSLAAVIKTLGEQLAIPGGVLNWLGIATGVYLPVYLYLSMRRVYARGRFATLLRMGVLFFAYFLSLLVITLGALLITILTI